MKLNHQKPTKNDKSGLGSASQLAAPEIRGGCSQNTVKMWQQQSITNFIFPSTTFKNGAKRKAEQELLKQTATKNQRTNQFDSGRKGLDTSNGFDGLSPDVEAPNQDPTKDVITPKMPPIILPKLQDPKETLNTVKSCAPADILFKMIRGEQAVLTRDAKTFALVREELSKINIKHYTFTQQNEKHKKLVLKGLPEGIFNTEEIIDDLKNKCSEVTKVVQLKSLKKGEEKLLPSYQVSFTWNTNLSLVKKGIYSVGGHIISWEEYRRPKQYRVLRCFKCQAYNHSSKNCSMQRKCLKCAGTHEFGACQKKPEEPAKCANCSGAHPSNFKGCPAYKSQQQKLKKLDQKKNAPTTAAKKLQKSAERPLTYAGTGAETYSNVLKRNLANAPSRTQQENARKAPSEHRSEENVFGSFNREVSRLFGADFFTMMQRIEAFWVSYREIRDDATRKRAMLNFMLNVTNCSP